jgi:AraC-like DNA-binding protein
MNVTEAAIAVGYNSISSFSRAFSAHFGANPLNILKKTAGSRKSVIAKNCAQSD